MNPEFERSYENNVKPCLENIDQQTDEELHRLCDSSQNRVSSPAPAPRVLNEMSPPGFQASRSLGNSKSLMPMSREDSLSKFECRNSRLMVIEYKSEFLKFYDDLISDLEKLNDLRFNAGSDHDFISMSRDLIERFTERLQKLFKLLDETAELIVDNGELILAKNI